MSEQKCSAAEFSRNMSHDSLLDPNSSVKLPIVPGEGKKISSRQKTLFVFGLLVIVFAIVLTAAIISSKKSPIRISTGNSLLFSATKL